MKRIVYAVFALLGGWAIACSGEVDGGGSGGGAGSGGNNMGGGSNSGGAGGAPSCQSRVMAAGDLVNTAVMQNLSCMMDSDCTLVWPETKCAGACPIVVNNQGVSAVQMAIAQANATYCDTYQQDGCPYATPSCALITPVCKNNLCDFQIQ